MKPSSFFILREGKACGPYSRDYLQTVVYAGDLSPDTLYSYDRAREWRPLTHLLGPINPQVIEDNRKRFYIAISGEAKGPFSYNQLKDMLREREISHQTLFAVQGIEEWKPLAQMPLPRIPDPTPPEGVPHESEWEAHAQKTTVGSIDGITVSMAVGSYWTDDGYYLWEMHSPKSSSAGKMYLGGPVRLERLREMFQSGEVRGDVPCARIGAKEWLCVADDL